MGEMRKLLTETILERLPCQYFGLEPSLVEFKSGMYAHRQIR